MKVSQRCYWDPFSVYKLRWAAALGRGGTSGRLWPRPSAVVNLLGTDMNADIVSLCRESWHAGQWHVAATKLFFGPGCCRALVCVCYSTER